MTKNKFNFTVLATMLAATSLFTSCKKDSNDDDDNNTTPPPTTVTINSEMQVSFKINGTAVSYLASAYPINHYKGGSIATFPDSSTFVFGSSFLNSNFDEMFGIDKGTLHAMGNPAATASFEGYFAIATHPYSANDNTDYQGVIVRIMYNGTMYSSINGSANQSGSQFKIDDNQSSHVGYDYMKIKASFNCKLYDAGGSSITLTDGVVVTNFGNI